VIAARLSGVPVYVHESDLSIGLANKIAYKCATKMYATFEQPSSLTKIEHVGAVTKVGGTKSDLPQELEEIRQYFDKELPTLLFVGGSAGAKVFNDFVSQNQATLTERYNVINLTGDASLDVLSNRLFRRAYVTDLYQPLMDLADVVVTRGGSNTIFELLAMAKLHIIVPLGREASRGDQIENADYFVKKGYAVKLEEKQLTLEGLEASVEQVLRDKESYYQAMKNSHEIKSVEDFYAVLKNDINKGKK
jgi:UDP-N-acetylglucosamine--N-acetylmuramyl-(pentapeptide) pyrophosphoryl-undecaprenol N-acetylglucosamine transferase